MREGTTQPAEGEVSEDTDSTPERAKTRGRTLFAPSNVHDAASEKPESGGLTVTDFSNLVRFSSAAIGCISFSTPVSCEYPPDVFANLLYTTTSRCLQASVSFAHNHGLTSPELLIGKPLAYLLPESRGFKQILSEWSRRNFTREGFECAALDLQGHPSVLHVAMYGHLEKNRLHRMWVVTRDISALSRAIRQSGRTEKYYRHLLNQRGLFFFRTHLDGTISFCTPATLETLLVEQTHGNPLEKILERACHPDDRHALDHLSFHRHSLARDPLEVSLRILSRSRGLLQLTLHQIPHSTSDEIDSYDILGVERGAHETSSSHAFSPDTLAACLAHDVNNQLVVASATIELACNIIDDEHPAKEFLRTALQAVSQSASINSQNLHLTSGLHTTPKSIDLNALFLELIDHCDAIIPEGVTLTECTSSLKLTAWADRTHIRQILLNLIINARDAIGESGIITLSATVKGIDSATGNPGASPAVCISVSDNGPGIDEAVSNTLFTPFVSTKSRGAPRGLGLAMVRTLVEKNAGSISVTSARGIGTTFTVTLPTNPQAALTSSTERPSPPRPVPRQKLSVLVADDESEVRRTLVSALTSRGHQAIAVPDLHSLHSELARADTPVDVVIVDDGMTESPLKNLLDEFRTRHPKIEVLFTSGDPTASENIPQKGICSRFLAKPFSLDALFDAVEVPYPVNE